MISLHHHKHFEVIGPNGGISTKIYLPDSHDSGDAKYHLLILMHGFMGSKSRKPISPIAKKLSENGYAVLSFDFEAHGKSEGKFIDMTISNEIADAKAVLDYARSLPFVKDISFLGHSQGGVVAGMLAGELENSDSRPKCLVQLAPAAVLKDYAASGKFMLTRCNPSNPPEYILFWFHKLGRKFILETQKLDIIGSSSRYSGNVCIIHGERDRMVPVEYSRQYDNSYKRSELHIISKETHNFNKKPDEVLEIILRFLRANL